MSLQIGTSTSSLKEVFSELGNTVEILLKNNILEKKNGKEKENENKKRLSYLRNKTR